LVWTRTVQRGTESLCRIYRKNGSSRHWWSHMTDSRSSSARVLLRAWRNVIREHEWASFSHFYVRNLGLRGLVARRNWRATFWAVTSSSVDLILARQFSKLKRLRWRSQQRAARSLPRSTHRTLHHIVSAELATVPAAGRASRPGGAIAEGAERGRSVIQPSRRKALIHRALTWAELERVHIRAGELAA